MGHQDVTLPQLISLYQQEQQQLQALVDAAVAEQEYDLAHNHQQALQQLNRQLQTLQRLNDPHFEEKERQQRRITRL